MNNLFYLIKRSNVNDLLFFTIFNCIKPWSETVNIPWDFYTHIHSKNVKKKFEFSKMTNLTRRLNKN